MTGQSAHIVRAYLADGAESPFSAAYAAGSVGLPEIPDEYKELCVTVFDEATETVQAWPFRKQEAAEAFIRRVDAMPWVLVYEYDFVYGSGRSERDHCQ